MKNLKDSLEIIIIIVCVTLVASFVGKKHSQSRETNNKTERTTMKESK